MLDLSQTSSAAPELCLIARRNNSLTRQGRWTVFATLAAISLTLAFAFLAAGAWPVLPYSILEISVLAVAFACVERRAGDWERLTIAGDRVVAERSLAGVQERREWNRRWLEVRTTPSRLGRPARLALCGAGVEWDFGATLPEEERFALARELKRIVGPR
jgi:uncharacterized membrane protein